MDKESKTLENGIVYISCNYLSYGDYDNSCAVERANVHHLKEHDNLKDSIESWSMNNWNRGQYLSDNHRSENGFATWQTIQSDCKLIETYGGHYSIQLWVREDVWDEMELDSMDDYCSLDDGLVSEIEMEMEDEAWDDRIKSDLIKSLPDELTPEQETNQEVKCMNCCWEGKAGDLIEDIVYDFICPKCNNPYSLKFYPLNTLREYADELSDDTLLSIYRYCCEKTNTYGVVESGGNWYIDIKRLEDCFREVIEQYYNGNELCCTCSGQGTTYKALTMINICETCNGTGFINANKEAAPIISNDKEN